MLRRRSLWVGNVKIPNRIFKFLWRDPNIFQAASRHVDGFSDWFLGVLGDHPSMSIPWSRFPFSKLVRPRKRSTSSAQRQNGGVLRSASSSAHVRWYHGFYIFQRRRIRSTTSSRIRTNRGKKFDLKTGIFYIRPLWNLLLLLHHHATRISPPKTVAIQQELHKKKKNKSN